LIGKIDALDQKATGKTDALDQKFTGKIDALDQKLTGKIDALDQKLTARIDELKSSFMSFQIYMEKALARLETSRVADRVWWLLMSGALLGIMARAFKWI
jgi:hypothetical protein